jgi:hypothetical protein
MEGVAYADQKCRKLFMGGVSYSLEFQRMDTQVGFWNALLQRNSGKTMSSHFLQRMIKKAGITEGLIRFSSMNKDEILAKQKEAYQAYRHFVAQKSVIARVNWLEDLAKARATEALQIQANKHKGARYQCRKPLKEGETAQSKATATELRQLCNRERLRTSAR